MTGDQTLTCGYACFLPHLTCPDKFDNGLPWPCLANSRDDACQDTLSIHCTVIDLVKHLSHITCVDFLKASLPCAGVASVLPWIFLMPGANCYSHDYTFLETQLASRGYLVAVLDQLHPVTPSTNFVSREQTLTSLHFHDSGPLTSATYLLVKTKLHLHLCQSDCRISSLLPYYTFLPVQNY